MDKFLQLMTMLFNETKDPSTFLKRLLTLLVGVIIYLFLMYTSEVMSFIKTFSTSAVLEQVQEQRIYAFPTLAREKSMILYSQTHADAVFVVKYKPESINDYQTIVAWEGNAQLDKSDMADKAVNKTSNFYRTQLDGFNFEVRPVENQRGYYSNIFVPTFKNVDFDYIYTCPVFNLNNIYSGYIAIAWEKIPIDNEDIPGFRDYLAKLCGPQQRALGRAL